MNKARLRLFATKTFNITDQELSVLIESIDSLIGGIPAHKPDSISVFLVSDRLKANDTIEFWSLRRDGVDKIYYQFLNPIFAT
jgi:hypothetical protein